MGRDMEKRRAYNKAWRARNKEHCKTADKTWQQNNPLKHMIRAARKSSKRRGIEFSITEDDFTSLPSHCPILEIELTYGGACEVAKPSAASFDRIDNSKGYIKGNVQIISWRANKLKADATVLELQKLIAYMMKTV